MSAASELPRPRVIPPDELLYSDEGSSIYSSDEERHDVPDQKTTNETKIAATTIDDRKIEEVASKPKPVSKRQRRRNRRARYEAHKAAATQNGKVDATAEKTAKPEQTPRENLDAGSDASTVQSGGKDAKSEEEATPVFKLIVKGYRSWPLYQL